MIFARISGSVSHVVLLGVDAHSTVALAEMDMRCHTSTQLNTLSLSSLAPLLPRALQVPL